MKKLILISWGVLCFALQCAAQGMAHASPSDTLKGMPPFTIHDFVLLNDSVPRHHLSFTSARLSENLFQNIMDRADNSDSISKKPPLLTSSKNGNISPNAKRIAGGIKVPDVTSDSIRKPKSNLQAIANSRLSAEQRKLAPSNLLPVSLSKINMQGIAATPANQNISLPNTNSQATNSLIKNTTALPATVLNNTLVSGKTLINQATSNNPLSANSLPAIKNLAVNPLTTGKLGATQFLALNNALSQNFNMAQSSSLSMGLALENDFQYQPIPLIGNSVQKFQNIVSLTGNLKLFNVPLSLNVSNNHAAFNGQNPFANNLFKIGFTPQSLSGLMQSQLQQYSSLKNTIFHGFDFTDYVHQTITEQVNSLNNSVGSLKNSPLGSYLQNPNKLQELIQMSDSQLRQKLEAVATQKTIPGGTLKSDSAGLNNINKLKADSVAMVVTSIKAQLVKNGLDPDKLILDENYLSGRTSSAFNATETASALHDNNSLNSLQSFFKSVTDFKVGTFGNQIPGSTDNQGKLLDGGSLSIKAGDFPLTFGFGKVNDISSLKDANYTSSVYAYTQDVTYIGAQLHHSIFGNVKVSMVSSFSSQSNNFQYSNPVLPGNSVAFTLTKEVKMGDWGNLALNVSKSSTLFDNNYSPGSEAILEKKAGADVNLNNNLFESLSVGFNHTLDIRQLDAHENVYFSYSGLGYQNPSNNGYTGNTIKAGGDLKKKLMKNKLVLDFRTDYDVTPMSYTENDKWKNYQVSLDSRYQITNHFNISFRYTATGTDKDAAGISTSVYGSQKLEFDANDTYKIGRFYSTSALMVGNQILSDAYITQSKSSLLNINYIQSVLFKESSLTGTVFYNKELSNYQLIGNMLTADVSYQYKLFKKFQLSSGVTYLSNEAIARQLGIKQSLQLIAEKHYDVSASVNLNKNLITPEYADLYSQCRAELVFKYHFAVN